MTRDDRTCLARLDERVGRLEKDTRETKGSIRRIYQQRERDRKSATTDADNRQRQVLDAVAGARAEITNRLEKMNGHVREHGTKIAAIEGERRAEDRFAGGIDPKRVAAGGAGAGAGVAGIIYGAWKLYEAWASAGSPTP
jgi:chromosome segregation ATPase